MGGVRGDLYLLAASTRQRGRHAGAEHALRCLGLLLDAMRPQGTVVQGRLNVVPG